VSIYGKEFAAVYNDQWAFWGSKMWPFLEKVAAAQNPDARTWLDLCCGCGSLLKFVCESGFAAVGVDVSPHQLKHAKKNAPGATYVRSDVRRFSLGRKFDVITCLFDSLNYLTRKKDLERVFRAVRRHLESGGLFAFDVNTFEGLQDQWCETSVRRARGRTVIIKTSFDEKRALGRCLVTGFLKEGRLYRRFEEEHIERGYRAGEIEDLLARAGLTFEKYDGYVLSAPQPRSGRLLYLCCNARQRGKDTAEGGVWP